MTTIFWLLLLLPFAAGGAVFLIGGRLWPKLLLAATALIELVLAGGLFAFGGVSAVGGGLLALDGIACFFMGLTILLFALAAFHTWYWLDGHRSDVTPGRMSDRIFCGCLLLFFGAMLVVPAARNFGLLWVAVEATTLASAPLIIFSRTAGALEAMWKYLLICSVGIGFALLGTFFLAVSASFGGSGGLAFAGFPVVGVHSGWFRAGFVFILAGYGTKIGLVPFHSWLPDAHSEAPAPVSALFSGALLNCAFVAVIRVWEAAPPEALVFCNRLLIVLGLLSVAVAALFIAGQSDFKRMLAYSSVEHMGLIVLAWAIFPAASMIHIAGHTLLKGMMFLTAGNILALYGTRAVSGISGLFGRSPGNASLWLIGVLLLCGTPPSPLFISEYLLVRQCFLNGDYWLGGAILVLLFMVFAGMSAVVLKMVCGRSEPSRKNGFALLAAPLLLLTLAVVSGVVLLTAVEEALR